MPKVDLTNEQVKQLLNILSTVQIRGSDALTIVQLSQALQISTAKVNELSQDKQCQKK